MTSHFCFCILVHRCDINFYEALYFDEKITKKNPALSGAMLLSDGTV